MARSAEIAGAGFAGLAMAAALARRGWRVRVHERSPEVRAFGAGIWIWENGIHALHSIGAADEAFGDRPAAAEFVNWDPQGRVVHRTVYADLYANKGCRVFIVTRQRLLMSIYHAALAAGVEVVTGSKAIGAEGNGTLLVEGGAKYRADLVVGADGVHSSVRDSLGLLKRRIHHPDGAIRLLLPHLPDYADSWNDNILRGWWSGGRRVMYNPVDDGKLYLCFTAPLTDRAGSTVPLDKASWTASFPMLTSLISRIGPDVRYDPFVSTKLHRWRSGRVAIIGDAAHSMVPGLGQGCGQSLMNAVSLAHFLDASTDIEAGLDSWEQACRPLTEHTQFWSAFAWPKSRWPIGLARFFFQLPVWGNWVAAKKARTGDSVPIGGDFPRWHAPPHPERVAVAA